MDPATLRSQLLKYPLYAFLLDDTSTSHKVAPELVATSAVDLSALPLSPAQDSDMKHIRCPLHDPLGHVIASCSLYLRLGSIDPSILPHLETMRAQRVAAEAAAAEAHRNGSNGGNGGRSGRGVWSSSGGGGEAPPSSRQGATSSSPPPSTSRQGSRMHGTVMSAGGAHSGDYSADHLSGAGTSGGVGVVSFGGESVNRGTGAAGHSAMLRGMEPRGDSVEEQVLGMAPLQVRRSVCVCVRGERERRERPRGTQCAVTQCAVQCDW